MTHRELNCALQPFFGSTARIHESKRCLTKYQFTNWYCRGIVLGHEEALMLMFNRWAHKTCRRERRQGRVGDFL
jgi:hypothetical protein